jgi:hypothetical protein
VTLRNVHYLLLASAIVFAAGSVLAIWLAVQPLSLGQSAPSAPKPAATAAQNASIIQLQQFANTFDLDLRRPLYDPPPPAPVITPPAPPPPPLALQLTGTVIEPGHSRAILVDPSGKVTILAVGGTMAQVTIISIDQRSVQVQYLGRTITLTVPKAMPQ